MLFLPMLKLPLATGHLGWLAPELAKVLRWGRATLGGYAGCQWYLLSCGRKRNPSLVPYFKFEEHGSKASEYIPCTNISLPCTMETLPRV